MAATASLVVLVAAIRPANAIPCPNKAVFFYHLPKTGGSTFTHLFRPGSSHFVSARSYADAQSALRGLRDCDERAKEARGWFLLEVHPIDSLTRASRGDHHLVIFVLESSCAGLSPTGKFGS